MPICCAGVPSSSFLTTSTASPHSVCRTSPRLWLVGSPRLRVLPLNQLRARSPGSHLCCAGVSGRLRLALHLASDPRVSGLGWAADHGVHQVSGGLLPRAAPLGAASRLGISFPSMHSCPSEPSLPAVAAAHPRVLPSRCVSPGLPAAPSSVCLSLGSRVRTPLSSFTRRHGLLLPRTPLRVCVAGASRPPMTAPGRHSVCTLCRLEPVGCASPRRCRFVSTSGYFRR